MNNRNIRIIAILLAAFIAVCNVSNCYMRTQAAELVTSGYTAEKVLAVILAVAGVALSQSDYQMIWQDGHIDTSALLNNMRLYSRSLYNAVSNAMYLGAAGVTKITLQQDILSLLKTWAQQYFGTSVGDRNIFGSISEVYNFFPASSGRVISHGYMDSTADYSTTYTENIAICIQYLYPTTYHGAPAYAQHSVYCIFPKYANEFTSSSSWSVPYNTGQSVNRWTLGNLNNQTVNFESLELVFAPAAYAPNPASAQFPYLEFPYQVYVHNVGVGQIGYVEAVETAYEIVKGYWAGTSSLDSTETYQAEVLDNDGNPATLGGIIGAGTSAALDALGNVVLSGAATITLPSDETMEDDLTDVVTGILPWTSFLEKLGLIAITGAETAAQINEQAQSLPTPSYNGAYTLDLRNLFPFCIPFDIVRILSAFNATPQAPHFTFNLPTGYQGGVLSYTTYSIDLAQFETVAQVVRVLEYISFVLGLALITRDLIRG